MLHWTNEPRLLAILKQGDIQAYSFNPPRSGPQPTWPRTAESLPQILELKDRGIFVDFAHGNHLQWDIAEKAARQGWFPDTISPTSIARTRHRTAWYRSAHHHGQVSLFGLTVNQAIERVTANPARILKFPEKIRQSGTRRSRGRDCAPDSAWRLSNCWTATGKSARRLSEASRRSRPCAPESSR